MLEQDADSDELDRAAISTRFLAGFGVPESTWEFRLRQESFRHG